MSSNSYTTSTADYGGDRAISALHSDIIQTHILTRLDGPSLVSTGCASSQLQALCTEEKLWVDICNSTWPSTTDPRVRNAISNFSAGHRSFFSHSFPTVHQRRNRVKPGFRHVPEIISAVDIHYKNNPVYSEVAVTETTAEWFLCSPFRVDLLDPKERVPMPVLLEGNEEKCRSNLEDHMTLSWVVIDPTRNRAVNLSSRRPVSVQRHWLTGEMQLQYALTMVHGDKGSAAEMVQCNITVTCGGREGGELHVREVSLQVQDLEGKSLSGEDILGIVAEAAESGVRRKGKDGEERERHGVYMEMVRKRRERKQRRERRLDMVCIATGVTIFMAFWVSIWLR